MPSEATPTTITTAEMRIQVRKRPTKSTLVSPW